MNGAAAQQPYIRHPVDVPVHLNATPAHDWPSMDLLAHGAGGVCVPSRLGYQPGTVLEVRVSPGGCEQRFRGQVLWRRGCVAGYELGLAFAREEDAFQARMIEQLCHIDAFRRREFDAGVPLSLEQAARLWIARHSYDFPLIGGFLAATARA